MKGRCRRPDLGILRRPRHARSPASTSILRRVEYVAVMGDRGSASRRCSTWWRGSKYRRWFDQTRRRGTDDARRRCANDPSPHASRFRVPGVSRAAYLTVSQNVALPLSLLGGVGGEAQSRVTAMLAAVGLSERGDERASECPEVNCNASRSPAPLVACAADSVLPTSPRATSTGKRGTGAESLARTDQGQQRRAVFSSRTRRLAARTCDRISAAHGNRLARNCATPSSLTSRAADRSSLVKAGPIRRCRQLRPWPSPHGRDNSFS